MTLGSWISFGYQQCCEIMANAGFEWLVIDMEHTAIDAWQAQRLIQIIELAGITPLVRVGKNDPLIIKRAMDSGAHGIIVPMINSRVEALDVVKAVHYPPKGNRGVGLGRAQQYGLGFEGYQEWLKRESIIVIQIEHIDAVNNLEEILDIEEIDCFMVGPYDLSGSVGQPGNFSHPKVYSALDKIKQVVEKKIKPGGFHVVHSDIDKLNDIVRSGYTFIAYGTDMIFFAEKMNTEAKNIRGFKK